YCPCPRVRQIEHESVTHSLVKMGLQRMEARSRGCLALGYTAEALERTDQIDAHARLRRRQRTRLVERYLVQEVISSRARICNFNRHVPAQLPLDPQRPLLNCGDLERIAGYRQADREDRGIGSASGRVVQEGVVYAYALIRLGIREPVLLDYADQAAVIVD